jgi:hypothetical protein
MAAGETIAIIALLSHIYLAGSPLMMCLVGKESDFNMRAVNGVHVSGPQWRHPANDPDESTFLWIAEKAIADPTFMHADYVREHMTPDDDLSSLLVMAWALANGYESHWSTLALCEEER